MVLYPTKVGKMMFDEDQNKKSDDPKKPPGGFKVPSATWLAWIAIVGSIGALMLLHSRMGAPDLVTSAMRVMPISLKCGEMA